MNLPIDQLHLIVKHHGKAMWLRKYSQSTKAFFSCIIRLNNTKFCIRQIRKACNLVQSLESGVYALPPRFQLEEEEKA
jgi:hypothetical protein